MAYQVSVVVSIDLPERSIERSTDFTVEIEGVLTRQALDQEVAVFVNSLVQIGESPRGVTIPEMPTYTYEVESVFQL